MKLLSQIISGAIFLFVGSSLFIQGQTENRASKAWEVQQYDLTATLPAGETARNLPVTAVLTLKNISGGSGDRLTLRIAQDAEVSTVKVNGSDAEFSKREEKITETRSLQRVIVSLPPTPNGAAFSVELVYKLTIRENTGVSVLSPAGSMLLPLSFWYPTPTSWFFSRGGDFAPFKVTLNGAGSSQFISSGTHNSSSFEQKLNGQPFFITGNWDTVESDGVSVLVPKGAGADEKKRAEEVASLTAEAKAFTETLLGPAPAVPLRVVAVKRSAGFAGGGTIFVPNSLFKREKIDAQTAMSVAEAVAKLWLGEAYLVSGDGFGLIREGLTRYIATEFLEKKYGKEIADIERLRQRVAYGAVVKRDSPLRIASPLDDYYYASVTNKGAMVWRLLAMNIGRPQLFEILRGQLESVDLAAIRQAFAGQKEVLDYQIDEVSDMNLLVGLPQTIGGQTKSAIRNTGAIPAAVDVVAVTASGQKIRVETVIPAKGFGEAAFNTSEKIVRTEIDTEKLYPQTEYSDDVAPRGPDEADVLLVIKRAFDKQDFAGAEKTAVDALRETPRFDDARTWLGRALLAQGKGPQAEREFQAVLDEKLPTARSLAWANVGLGESAFRSGKRVEAVRYFEAAIRADAEYGATLAARLGRNKAGGTTTIDESVKSFFTQFDKAAISGGKAALDALMIPGEVPRFSGGVAGAQEWRTSIVQVDRIDADTAIVEANLTIRLLNKEQETGIAVYQISRVAGGWKLSGVEMFEVR